MAIQARIAKAGITGVVAAAAALAYYFEGEDRQTYADPVGILTACVGHTGPDVKLGQLFSEKQCTELFVKDLRHAQATVERCTPGLPEAMKPSLISFVFNVGQGNYCTSTLARKANAGDYLGACKEIYRWVYAGGRKLPGLVKRRAAEAQSCIEGVIP